MNNQPVVIMTYTESKQLEILQSIVNLAYQHTFLFFAIPFFIAVIFYLVVKND